MTKLGRLSVCAAAVVAVGASVTGCDPVDQDALVSLDTECVALWQDADHEPNLPGDYAYGSEGDYGAWTDGTGAVVGYGAAEDAAIYATVRDALACPSYPYVVGDGGQGVPTADDVAACSGEITYDPRSDSWTCEGQTP